MSIKTSVEKSHVGNPKLLRKSIATFSLCMAALISVYGAGPWYVATNGVDQVGNGTEANPFETIQYAIDSASAGDTIWVKPGIYDKGGAVNVNVSEHTNRVVLTKKVHLKSTGGAAVTHIVGAPDPDVASGVGPKAIRCMVSPDDSSLDSTITGFTLRDGYGDNGTTGHNHRSGGFLQFEGQRRIYLNECVISNCSAWSYGGVRGGTLVRCLLTGNRSTARAIGAAVCECNLLHCLVTGNCDSSSDQVVSSCTLVNCTVALNTGSGVTSSTTYNSIVCGNTKSDVLNGSESNNASGGYPVVSPLDRDWRVVAGRAAYGAGDPAYITSCPFDLPASIDKAKDFTGNAFDTSAEHIHAGCVQASALVEGGAVYIKGPCSFGGVSVPDGGAIYAQSTNGLTQWPVKFAHSNVSGATTNYLVEIWCTGDGGVPLFPDLEDKFVMFPPVDSTLVLTNTPLYRKGRWVDPATGSDTANDGSEAHPYKTIQKAVDEGGSGTVIFLAPGLYDKGGVDCPDPTVKPYGPCRVWITGNTVRIVGAGADRTVIAGAPDPATGGFGANAVRCAGASGLYVAMQGVTLSNGWTQADADYGVSAAASSMDLTDSWVTDCHCYSSMFDKVNVYRSKVWGNEVVLGSLFASGGRVVCSWLGSNKCGEIGDVIGYIGTSYAYFATMVTTEGQSLCSYKASLFNCVAVGGRYLRSNMTSKGNVFWKFIDVGEGCAGTFENPRLRKDSLHVSTLSSALTAGVAPNAAAAAGTNLANNWWRYSSTDIEGNLLRFNSDGTAMAGAAHEPVEVPPGTMIIYR